MPINDLVAAQNTAGAPLVRTEPIQERSAARIDALLDAAAEVVDEIGFDRLTTAMVAERAGASIGTVYRYFPDRIVLLQALRDRALLR
ncbi:helix-turn-helix domain-containing protein, partial [Leifsonia sp. NPDC056665]